MENGTDAARAGQRDPLAKLPNGWLRQNDHEAGRNSTRWFKLALVALAVLALALLALKVVNQIA